MVSNEVNREDVNDKIAESDTGLANLNHWLDSLVQSGDLALQENANKFQLSPINGDAGTRQYIRINGGRIGDCEQLLAVSTPLDSQDNQDFARIAPVLLKHGVRAPRIFAKNFTQGLLLIEDFGDRLYLGELNTDSVETLYGEAITTLLKMQQTSSDAIELPRYDREKLLQEMQLFPDWFVSSLLGYSLSDSESAMLQQVFDRLVAEALRQPTAFVHRDYHSRNLIYTDVGPPGVIDFQDAVVGPITYDLVSLLRDCYIRWPQGDVERWACVYVDMAVEAGLMRPVSHEQFLRWFDWMGLQRHIKVLGIFSRLFLRDQKSTYLHDLPLVMRHTLEVAENYSELNEFVNWFKNVLLPLIEQQSWYVDYQNAGEIY